MTVGGVQPGGVIDTGDSDAGTVPRGLPTPTGEAVSRGSVPRNVLAGVRSPEDAVDSKRIFGELLNLAKLDSSERGPRITKREVERALGALTWEDGAVSPTEYQSAVVVLSSRAFQRNATRGAAAAGDHFVALHGPKPEGEPLTLDQRRELVLAAVRELRQHSGVTALSRWVEEADSPDGNARLAVMNFVDELYLWEKDPVSGKPASFEMGEISMVYHSPTDRRVAAYLLEARGELDNPRAETSIYWGRAFSPAGEMVWESAEHMP